MNTRFQLISFISVRKGQWGLAFVFIMLLVPSQSVAWEPREATVRDPVREQVEYHTVTRPAVERNRKTTSDPGTKTGSSTRSTTSSRASSSSRDDDDDDDRPTRNPHSTAPAIGHFNNPWAPYKEYEAGEAGDVGDLDTHHTAIQRAIAVADSCSSCAKSNFGDDQAGVAARRAVLNSVYAQEIKREYDRSSVPENRRNIPAGPLAAAAKYVHNNAPLRDENGEVIRDEDGIPVTMTDQEKAIDALVTSGHATYYYPDQVPVPQHNYDNATSSQKLGLRESLVIVAPGAAEYAAILNASGAPVGHNPEEMFGIAMNTSIYPGGIVVLNNGLNPESNQTVVIDGQPLTVPIVDPNNDKQIIGVMHEMSHAGETAIVNLTDKLLNNGRSLPETVEYGAGLARALITETPERTKALVDVNAYLPPDSESRVENHDQYVNQWTEVIAYSTQYPDREEGKRMLGKTLEEMGLSPDEAQVVAETIVNDESYRQVREALDTAADYLLED